MNEIKSSINGKRVHINSERVALIPKRVYINPERVALIPITYNVFSLLLKHCYFFIR